jgi:EXLDI family protein
MKAYELERDGQPDVAFEGELLAKADDHSHEGPRQNRWTEIRIYQTAGERLVVERIRHTRWQGESATHTVKAVDTAVEARDWLMAEDGGELTELAKWVLREAGFDSVCVEGVA